MSFGADHGQKKIRQIIGRQMASPSGSNRADIRYASIDEVSEVNESEFKSSLDRSKGR